MEKQLETPLRNNFKAFAFCFYNHHWLDLYVIALKYNESINSAWIALTCEARQKCTSKLTDQSFELASVTELGMTYTVAV